MFSQTLNLAFQHLHTSGRNHRPNIRNNGIRKNFTNEQVILFISIESYSFRAQTIIQIYESTNTIYKSWKISFQGDEIAVTVFVFGRLNVNTTISRFTTRRWTIVSIPLISTWKILAHINNQIYTTFSKIRTSIFKSIISQN